MLPNLLAPCLSSIYPMASVPKASLQAHAELKTAVSQEGACPFVPLVLFTEVANVPMVFSLEMSV